ncbi:hypothetical protein [Pengzhenrongella phosphoraccumulans]|uniref:hypothetical protein n=1 Tax=Pengzhenrongella phosphoraccumulans TaxID=3114394 RepID=UPI003890E7B1
MSDGLPRAGARCAPAARPRRGEVDDDHTADGDQAASAAQQQDGVAADADVAVGEQRAPPAALAGQWAEQVAPDRRDSPGAGLGDRLGHEVDPEDGLPSGGQVLGHAAGPAAQVDRRTDAVGQDGAVAGVGGPPPAWGRDELGLVVQPLDRARLALQCRGEHRCEVHVGGHAFRPSRQVRANRVVGARAATW